MDPFLNLTEKNYLLYAAKCYQSPQCVWSELADDLKRIKYIKRLLRKYKLTKEIKERLILNHIICLSNVFGTEATTRLLFFRIDIKDYDVLKTFLLFLEYLPDIVMGINGINIMSSDIPVDLKVAKILRSL